MLTPKQFAKTVKAAAENPYPRNESELCIIADDLTYIEALCRVAVRDKATLKKIYAELLAG